MMPMNSENKKGFFDRPEGVTGMILIAGAGVALVYFSGVIFPFLIALAANMITLIASFSAKIYGKRSHQNRKKKEVEAPKESEA